MAQRMSAETSAFYALPMLRTSNRGQFPLLRLCGELRNMIYRAAITDHRHECGLGRKYRCNEPNPPYAVHVGTFATLHAATGHPQAGVNLELLTTCRQMNEEATPFLYRTVLFKDFEDLHHYFCKQLAKNLRLIRHIRLYRFQANLNGEVIMKFAGDRTPSWKAEDVASFCSKWLPQLQDTLRCISGKVIVYHPGPGRTYYAVFGRGTLWSSSDGPNNELAKFWNNLDVNKLQLEGRR